MKKKRIFGIILSAAVFLSAFNTFPAQKTFAASYDDYASNQVAVTEVGEVYPDSAYVIFGDKIKSHKMKFFESDSAGRYDELYNEKVEWNGIQARQVYTENYIYLKLDEGFATKDDSVFMITIDYWDYGGGGYYYVEYIPRDSQEIKSERIYKLGLDENGVKTAGTWFRVTICLDDCEFTGKFDNGADIRIRQGAYNSFSKVEFRNISRDAKPGEHFGTFNNGKADTLHSLGAFDGFGEGEEFDPQLEKELTREEALVQLIKSYRMDDEALEKNMKSGFRDVSAEGDPYVAMAIELGIIEKGETLGAKEKFPQRELVIWYLKLLGVENEALSNKAYDLAKEYNLISKGGMVFQPEKNANIDAFVLLAMNIFSMKNLKTGYCPFTDGFNSGDFDMEILTKLNDDNLWNWLMSTPFKLPKTTHIDEYTGRTYYTVNFFGQQAIKPYFTMNCMSTDETRIYFRTKDYKYWEYNIETEMCRYMCKCPGENGAMVTPQNNFWYVNSDYEIGKIDLDTYEETIVAKLPEWQKSVPTLLQVNNAETKLSLWWRDNSGEFDRNYYTRIPILDIKTGVWDLSHWYGFDYPDYPPNHICINPEYDNLAFFAHETVSASQEYFYQGSLMPDRVWVVNMDTDEYYNAIKQKWFRSPDPSKPGSGYTGEAVGHESWSHDGEWIMAVRHPAKIDSIRASVKPDAHFVMQRKDGTDKRYIQCDFSLTEKIIGNGGSDSNHASLSFDGRWIVSDNNYYGGKFSGLYVFDAETGASHLMAIVPQSSANPGHLHPQFSPKGTYAIFGCWNEDYTIPQFGWMDVSDITSNPAPGGRYDISATCDAIDYDGNFDFNVDPFYGKNGEYEGTKVPAGKELYVNVKSSVTESDNTSATITIAYKDDTWLPIALSYHRWIENSNEHKNYLTDDKLYINRTNTGRIMTKTLKFDDICLGNMDLFGTDFRIRAAGSAATILSVDVSLPQEKEDKK